MRARSSENDFSVRAERASAVYEEGEPISFCLDVGANSGNFFYEMIKDGFETLEKGTVASAGKTTRLKLFADVPGFYELRVAHLETQISQRAVAAVSPEKIQLSLPSPSDFSDFWKEKIRSLDTNSFCLERVSPQPRGAVVDKLVIQTGIAGNVYGWVTKPHAHPPFPAVVLFHGAGVYRLPFTAGLEWIESGFMAISLNPHSIPNDENDAFYQKMREELADYRTRGSEDRERSYFVSMFLRAIAAVTVVHHLKEWDGENLFAVGHSQGAGQAIAAAAFNKCVRGLICSCCTHCDFAGPLSKRAPGWPQIVDFKKRADGTVYCTDERVLNASRYVDSGNFASCILCPAHFTVCFLDELCPPGGECGVYNRVPGPKAVRYEPQVGHEHALATKHAEVDWALRQLGRCTKH